MKSKVVSFFWSDGLIQTFFKITAYSRHENMFFNGKDMQSTHQSTDACFLSEKLESHWYHMQFESNVLCTLHILVNFGIYS